MRHERKTAEHIGNNVDNGPAMLAKVLAVHLTRHQEGPGQIRLNHCIPTLTKREVALKLFYWVRTFSEIATDIYPEKFQPQDKETVPRHYSPETIDITLRDIPISHRTRKLSTAIIHQNDY